MKLNKKKGFTIVELVIVIAVIAILAAVLIPNISKLVKKANRSADESLVRNLNTALSMDVEKHTTMSAALDAALKNGGYDLTTIVTKNEDSKILWDSKNDCFVYLNDKTIKYLPNTQKDKTVTDVDYFEIVDEVPALKDQKYSIYLTGTSNNANIEVKVGFDAGNNANNFNVNYSRTATGEDRQSVIIRTNGGTLTVDASNDTVLHYGSANGVTIESIYKESFHEYGKVKGVVNIKEGRFVAESGAEISFVNVTATDISKIEAIEIKSGAAVVGVTASSEEAKTALTNKVTGADLYLEGQTQDKVAYAKVGNDVTFYDTLQAALIDKAKVTLLKDTNESIVLEKGNVVLNLNGYTVKNSGKAHTFFVKYGASLTIEGEGLVDNTENGKATVYNNGTVVLNGGKYTRSCENGLSGTVSGGNSYYAITNYGVMTINDGVSVLFNGYYSSLIHNGYQDYDKEYKENENAAEPTMTINGGDFSGGINTMKNDDGGILTVNGGHFSNIKSVAFLNWNVATINGGVFDCDGRTVVSNAGAQGSLHDKGELTINGGTFNAKGGYGITINTAYSYCIMGTVKKAPSVDITVAPGYEWNADGVLVKSAN